MRTDFECEINKILRPHIMCGLKWVFPTYVYIISQIKYKSQYILSTFSRGIFYIKVWYNDFVIK